LNAPVDGTLIKDMVGDANGIEIGTPVKIDDLRQFEGAIAERCVNVKVAEQPSSVHRPSSFRYLSMSSWFIAFSNDSTDNPTGPTDQARSPGLCSDIPPLRHR
jgi:hypothetical protein